MAYRSGFVSFISRLMNGVLRQCGYHLNQVPVYVCQQLKMLFRLSGGEVVEVHGPSAEERRQFFADLILCHAVRPPPTHKQAGKTRVLCTGVCEKGDCCCSFVRASYVVLHPPPPPTPHMLTNNCRNMWVWEVFFFTNFLTATKLIFLLTFNTYDCFLYFFMTLFIFLLAYSILYCLLLLCVIICVVQVLSWRSTRATAHTNNSKATLWYCPLYELKATAHIIVWLLAWP